MGSKLKVTSLPDFGLVVQSHIRVFDNGLALELKIRRLQDGTLGIDAGGRRELFSKEIDLRAGGIITTLTLGHADAHILFIAGLLETKVEPLGARPITVHTVVADLKRGFTRGILKLVCLVEQAVLLVGGIDLELLPVAVGRSRTSHIADGLKRAALGTTVQRDVNRELLGSAVAIVVVARMPVRIEVAINQGIFTLTVAILNRGDVDGPLGGILVRANDDAFLIRRQNINLGDIGSLVLVLILPMMAGGCGQANLGRSRVGAKVNFLLAVCWLA